MKGYDDEHEESCRCAACVQALRAWNAANTKAATALRLADAAVIEAAEAMLEPDATEAWIGWRSNFPKLAKDLGLAVLARRKALALAEQAKEASRG